MSSDGRSRFRWTADPRDTLLPKRKRRRDRANVLACSAACAFIAAAVAQPNIEPTITWQAESPEFFHGAFFAPEPWAEPVASIRRYDDEEPGFYVPSGRPLWLVVEVDFTDEDARLCTLWHDPNGEPVNETCQRLPGGPARLSFPAPPNYGWPGGQYVARLFIEESGGRELAGEVVYGLVEEQLYQSAGPPGDDEIPLFPWPPPQPTTQTVLERALIARDASTLGDVADRLTNALAGRGYSEHSFYAVPGGFALATRLEQIEFDGTPKAEPLRWSAALPPREVFNLGDFVSALFTVPEGHYRIIVFVVNDRAFAASNEVVSREEADAWLRGGLNRLPRSIADLPFGGDHVATALIYQYRKIGQRDPIAHPNGAEPATRHLERSGILSALGQ